MAQSKQTADQVRHDAGAAAREAGHDLQEGARRIADEMRETGRDYAERAREKGEEYAGRARTEADRLYAAGQRKAEDVAHYAEGRYDELSEMVRRHPAQSLGIAAGIGFLVGLILARR